MCPARMKEKYCQLYDILVDSDINSKVSLSFNSYISHNVYCKVDGSVKQAEGNCKILF